MQEPLPFPNTLAFYVHRAAYFEKATFRIYSKLNVLENGAMADRKRTKFIVLEVASKFSRAGIDNVLEAFDKVANGLEGRQVSRGELEKMVRAELGEKFEKAKPRPEQAHDNIFTEENFENGGNGNGKV